MEREGQVADYVLTAARGIMFQCDKRPAFLDSSNEHGYRAQRSVWLRQEIEDELLGGSFTCKKQPVGFSLENLGPSQSKNRKKGGSRENARVMDHNDD